MLPGAFSFESHIHGEKKNLVIYANVDEYLTLSLRLMSLYL